MRRWFKRVWFLLRFHKSVPFLIDYFKSGEVGLFKKVISILLIAGYAIFPFDIIPDWLFVFGFLDDVAVAAWILQYIVKKAPQPLREKHGLNK
ncbi:hypothetical protein JNUCC1_02306 [Lentibacillus sp. JNUCC-1]|uniref:YkvA family protein n=1 Tax=Lentibacillus sp. JNUCC-1 TaxID=2654513 RepID=UPI0012E80C84|nr:DUF1232 domain-containing protein [Lentibacillus sp. JNUCC-1]MUV38468.1 hypothetical protein [Lentibacillus sp. JNUCC-1]